MGWLKRLFGIENEEPRPRSFSPSMVPLPPMPTNQMISDFPEYQETQDSELNTEEVVFVRLDRFEVAEKSFADVTSKLKEIEANIRAVDEINEKEDERLIGWNKDLERIKSLLNNIDNKIFDQVQ